MSKGSYENHALPYCFRSFARSKTSSHSCGLYVFHMGAVRPAIVGCTAPIWKSKHSALCVFVLLVLPFIFASSLK